MPKSLGRMLTDREAEILLTLLRHLKNFPMLDQTTNAEIPVWWSETDHNNRKYPGVLFVGLGYPMDLPFVCAMIPAAKMDIVADLCQIPRAFSQPLTFYDMLRSVRNFKCIKNEVKP